MNSVKISWVGQTFALAKCSDSGGKKSRIRRSKEERKEMVESFIKKYQKANNGNFPSLNLTNKEVGGSFYTVREIVREIIQENRVLGPAKLTLEEQDTDQVSEHYPLGSISIEPQRQLSISSSEFVTSDNQIIDKELVSSSGGQSTGHTEQSENGKYINGTWMGGEYEESNTENSLVQGSATTQVDGEPVFVKVQVDEKLDGVEIVQEAPIPTVTPIATGIIVESIPLKSAGKLTYDADWTSGEASDIPETLKVQEPNKLETATGNTGLLVHRIDSTEENIFALMDKKEAVNNSEPFQEKIVCPETPKSTASTLLEGIGVPVEVSQIGVLTLQAADQKKAVIGIEPKLVPAEIHSQNGTASGSTTASGESLSQEAISKTMSGNQHGQSTGEGSNSTLNRLNLESWEGATKKSAKAETNPFWTVLKEFISAFAKFWSE
ncbi:uncharacterized protein LOC122085821 [Macadamia integrifolia]|uniref:uncharacterized protein LOC122085821 n=1 Tax=Macadamia integrifolia TaxID=60698 RepID=UPI001C4FE135|nr:uncharacterized protein LOC122085821 [Macadamia integrifolia]